MRSGAVLLRAIGVLILGSLPLPSAAQNAVVDRFYVFGDSYSDGGNAFALARTPRTPPYAARHSDGPTAVEYMAKVFGLVLRYSEDAKAPADASLNFAVSGAWTSTRNNDAAMDGRTGLTAQVRGFEQRWRSGASFRAETTLFFIAIGINDVLFGTLAGQDSADIVSAALRNVENAVRALHAAGARHVAVATIPMVNLMPRAAVLPAAKIKAIEQAVFSLNVGYGLIAGQLRRELDADVFTLPWGEYYDALISNPSAFGMANTTPCLTGSEGGPVCPDPHRRVFFDALHPTTAAHQVVGYRLATQGWPHFTCPAGSSPGAVNDRPSCSFLSTPSGKFVEAPARATCVRLAFRQTADMCNNCTAPPWTGDLRRISGDEWVATYVDGHKRQGTARLRLTSESGAELVFHDRERNLYTRFDLVARRGLQRRGTAGGWTTTSEVLSTECQ